MKTTKKKSKSVFAKNIATRRKDLGLNQPDFAVKAGIGLSTLREIETDVSGGWPGTREAIAKALGCTVEELYAAEAAGSGKKNSNNGDGVDKLSEIREILNLVERIPMDILRALAEQADHAPVRAVLGIRQPAIKNKEVDRKRG